MHDRIRSWSTFIIGISSTFGGQAETSNPRGIFPGKAHAAKAGTGQAETPAPPQNRKHLQWPGGAGVFACPISSQLPDETFPRGVCAEMGSSSGQIRHYPTSTT